MATHTPFGSPHGTVTVGLPVAGRLVLVVGHGPAAAGAASLLLAQDAHVRVVASPERELTAALADLAARGRIELAAHSYSRRDLDGVWLVYPRSEDPHENLRIGGDACARRIWCIAPDHSARAATVTGRVTIVGGGPGDPGLITVRGLEALRAADVVVHDRLAPLALLADLAPSTLLIDAAKVPGGRTMPQEQINRHLVEHALDGRAVVRLKGGDPFVFGRGLEEIEACSTAGIAIDVVPGVSSAISVPGLAGISLTHRGLAHAFTVVSGHLAPGSDKSRTDWSALARSGATIVLLMAVETLPDITATLLAAGLDPDTPAASIQEGGTPRQRVVRSRLGRLAQDAAGIRPPAVTVIGEVVDHMVAGVGEAVAAPDARVVSGWSVT
jgi:uroporphyrin-III C-methyltransferase